MQSNPPKSGIQPTSSGKSAWKPFFISILFLGLTAVLNYLLLPILGYRASGFIFLICVFPVAVIFGLTPALAFAGGSALAWDFFFIPPQFTLSIQTSEDAMMNVTYFVVAIVSGFLGTRVRKQEVELKQRERDSKLLYELENKLSKQSSTEFIISESASFFKEYFQMETCFVDGSSGQMDFTPASTVLNLSRDEQQEALWVYRNEKRAGHGTSKFSNSRFTYLALGGNERSSGVMIACTHFESVQNHEVLIRKLCGNIGYALEREQYRLTTRRNQLLEASEKLHQTLLNSVSHELRTPITSILGNIAMIVDEPSSEDGAKKLVEIRASTERLNQTVTNLLDMSRIKSGTLRFKKDLFEMNDFIHSCVANENRLAEAEKVLVVESSQAAYFEGDEKLLETAVVNLIRNAARHSPQEAKVRISISANAENVILEVADDGPGIKLGEEEKVFEPFYSPSDGLGLGLPIVRAIIEAHQGQVIVDSHRAKGAAFVVTLPRAFLPASLGADFEVGDAED